MENDFAAAITCGLAALTEPSDAEIVEALDKAYPSGVNRSRIYQILQSLERNGLADSRDVDGRSKVYWVTDEGREAVREYHEWMMDMSAFDSLQPAD